MTLELKKVLGKFNLGTQDLFDSVKVCAFRTKAYSFRHKDHSETKTRRKNKTSNEKSVEI